MAKGTTESGKEKDKISAIDQNTAAVLPYSTMNFSDIHEAFSYIEGFTNLEKTQQYTVRTYRLDRMMKLLDHFGNPERSCRIIHAAGSKGKGSTCALTASALASLGYTAGLYSSPHVSTYLERFTMAGKFFDEQCILDTVHQMFSRLTNFLFPEARGFEHPTTFELLTLLAFLLFRQAGCDYGVIETGLGGRLDATNVVSPLVTAITPIELEHTNILGNTIAEIASEKAGIIKPGVPVVTAPQYRDALRVITQKAAEQGAEVHHLPDLLVHCSSRSDMEKNHIQLVWSDDTCDDLEISMLGSFQAENCAMALTILKVLNLVPGPAEREAALQGISSAVLPGRMEVIRRKRITVIDGAHTRRSVERIISSFRELFPAGGAVIFGAVTGKDHSYMAEAVLRHFDRIVISTPGTFKPSNPRELYELFAYTAQRMVTEGDLDASPIILLEPDPAQALLRAHDMLFDDEGLLVTGSFYMASEIRDLCMKEGPCL